jgi:phage gpG-like protein
MRVEADTSAAARMLREIRDRIGDQSPLMAVLAEEIAVMARVAFATETSPSGRKWAPTKDYKIAALADLESRGRVQASDDARRVWSRVRGRALSMYRRDQRRAERRGEAAHKILQETGGLLASVGASGDQRSLLAFATSAHAAVHQWGSRVANLPSRNFFPVTRGGRPMRQGPAGEWWRRLPVRIKAWIAEGRT